MDQILRIPAVEQATGLCSERLRQLEELGLFPGRFKITPGSGQQGAVGWLKSEITEWVRERAASRDEVPETPALPAPLHAALARVRRIEREARQDEHPPRRDERKVRIE